MGILKAHDWPGNIRELQNVIERAVVLAPDSVLRPALTELKQMTKQPSAAATRTLAEAEREHILEVLKQTSWLIGGRDGAATRLGLPRTTLVYKMRKLGIETRRSSRVRSVQQKHDAESSPFERAAASGLRTERLRAVANF
jgi:DNA-binding NtrC family response regulator